MSAVLLSHAALALLAPPIMDSSNPAWTTREWLEASVGLVRPIRPAAQIHICGNRRLPTASCRASGTIAQAESMLDAAGVASYANDCELSFFEYLVEDVVRGLDSDINRDTDRDVELTFLDVGSRSGRLVLAAAALWPWRFSVCAGVETAPDWHASAEAAARRVASDLRPRVRFVCANAANALSPPRGELVGGADVVFADCATWTSADEAQMAAFAELCGSLLPVGTRIITTDRALPTHAEDPEDISWRLQPLGQHEGRNAATGGTAMGYVYCVAKSRVGPLDRETLRQRRREEESVRRLELSGMVARVVEEYSMREAWFG